MIDILLEPTLILSSAEGDTDKKTICEFFEQSRNKRQRMVWSDDYDALIQDKFYSFTDESLQRVYLTWSINYNNLFRPDTFEQCEAIIKKEKPSSSSFTPEEYIPLQKLFSYYFTSDAEDMGAIPVLLVEQSLESMREFTLNGETKSPEGNTLSVAKIPESALIREFKAMLDNSWLENTKDEKSFRELIDDYCKTFDKKLINEYRFESSFLKQLTTLPKCDKGKKDEFGDRWNFIDMVVERLSHRRDESNRTTPKAHNRSGEKLSGYDNGYHFKLNEADRVIYRMEGQKIVMIHYTTDHNYGILRKTIGLR